MNIFIDTNIFLDLVLERAYTKEAIVIFNSCNKKLFQGFIADITLLNIDYIASKQTENIKEFLKVVNQSFNIVGADNKIFDLALNLNNNDLEDSVQYLCAKTSKCKVIVTNDKKFYTGDIKILNSREFVDKYIKLDIIMTKS